MIFSFLLDRFIEIVISRQKHTSGANNLLQLGLLASRRADTHTFCLAPQQERAPARPDYAIWISQFLIGSLDRRPEDHLGQIFASVLEVLVTVIASGSRNSEKIAADAALPKEFAETVLELAQKSGIWMMDVADQTESAIRTEHPTSKAMIECAQDLTDAMWNLSWTWEMSSLLGRKLWGLKYIYDDDDPIIAHDSSWA